MRVLLLLSFFIFLIGCSTAKYGYFVEFSAENKANVANEITQQLSLTYFPAKTQIIMKQKDDFSIFLVQSLRSKGYAVLEYSKELDNNSLQKNNYVPITLSYLIDNLYKDKTQYLVTLYVSGKQFNSYFLEIGNKVTSNGFWSIGSFDNQEVK